MTIAATRKQLMTYLADAEDEKIKALYTILEKEMKRHAAFISGEQHLSILEERREAYNTGKSKGSSWQEAHRRIRHSRPNY